ncbi:PREDICTED: uncharacterized protein LOC105958182 [Erythranthe guttata]|uniref:uncharacterized protein LOC105958182 n=1 Tax=Erythranthe guttata TaxID=4155 RepID=UPI00064D7415|nr:PREDICTED: uncharacterized protein LOC105958182 [Erythranthe guttata]|eukprot:XP_012837645.1 PREDICTED: uncharacterized protein LOC105958182 [Erythranthe guttata]
MEECTQWIIGCGEIMFWTDNWIEEQLIGPLPYDNNLTVAAAFHNISEFMQFIPVRLLDKISRVRLDTNIPDMLIFTLSQNGEFSSKAYYNHLRIWGPGKISVISRGIPLVSRCVCCKNPKQEDVPHLFFGSEIAKAVWKRVGDLFNLPSGFSSTKHALSTWNPKPKALSYYPMIQASVVCHTLREIWLARCKVVYDGGSMSIEAISRRVFHNIQHLGTVHAPRQPSTKIQRLRLEAAGFRLFHPPEKRGAWHKWEFPLTGCYKLNTDGSAKEDSCTGGGIIRDSGGNIIADFSSYFGEGSNNVVEFLAVWHGLRLCKLMGVFLVTVETDSLLVVNAIRSNCVAWDLVYVHRLWMQEVTDGCNFQHVFRQKNMVADRLANWAYTHKSSQEFFSGISLPNRSF